MSTTATLPLVTASLILGRHGTLTHTISSLCGGPSDAIGLPPAHTLMELSSLPFFSRAAHGRRLVGTRLWGTGMGTAGAPKRENHVKGQACLVCKRNSLLPLTRVVHKPIAIVSRCATGFGTRELQEPW